MKIHLSFEDYPKPTDWLQVKGLFSEEDTSIISSIPRKTDQPDVVLRFGYPIDLTHLPSPTRVLSLATAEYGTSDIFRTPGSPPWSNPGNVTLMVPSHWSINLFQDFEDIPSSNLLYLPHGFDSSYFYPSTKRSKLCKECLKFRESLGISSSAFIFLNTGSLLLFDFTNFPRCSNYEQKYYSPNSEFRTNQCPLSISDPPFEIIN